MLLLMIEKDMPIDCVLYADTGMEFPEMEAHIAKLDNLLYRERGIHITTLRHIQGFKWLMLNGPIQQERAIARRIANGHPLTGYGWPPLSSGGVGITEAQALQICYNRGFDFGGLYEIYHRASCWCCPLQRIDELRKLRIHHPELWARLREMDNRAREMYGPGLLGQFKKNWSVERLEERFAREDKASKTP